MWKKVLWSTGWFDSNACSSAFVSRHILPLSTAGHTMLPSILFSCSLIVVFIHVKVKSGLGPNLPWVSDGWRTVIPKRAADGRRESGIVGSMQKITHDQKALQDAVSLMEIEHPETSRYKKRKEELRRETVQKTVVCLSNEPLRTITRRQFFQAKGFTRSYSDRHSIGWSEATLSNY